MINLNRKLDDSERLILERSLRRINGLVAPWFTPHLQQVVFIYYNPAMTDTMIVLNCIRKLGYNANIVSL